MLEKNLKGAMVWAMDLDNFLDGWPLCTALAQRLMVPTSEKTLVLTLNGGDGDFTQVYL